MCECGRVRAWICVVHELGSLCRRGTEPPTSTPTPPLLPSAQPPTAATTTTISTTSITTTTIAAAAAIGPGLRASAVDAIRSQGGGVTNTYELIYKYKFTYTARTVRVPAHTHTTHARTAHTTHLMSHISMSLQTPASAGLHPRIRAPPHSVAAARSEALRVVPSPPLLKLKEEEED